MEQSEKELKEALVGKLMLYNGDSKCIIKDIVYQKHNKTYKLLFFDINQNCLKQDSFESLEPLYVFLMTKTIGNRTPVDFVPVQNTTTITGTTGRKLKSRFTSEMADDIRNYYRNDYSTYVLL
jgi:hypothetical protein